MRDRQGDLISVCLLKVDYHSNENGNHSQRESVIEANLKSPEVLNACFDQATVGFSVTDLEGRLIEVNPAFCSITGYSSDELRTQLEPGSLTHPEDLPVVRERLQALIAGDVPGFVVEKRYVCKTGDIVWVQNSVSLIRDKDGHPQSVVRLTQDITEKKLAEASLHKVQAHTEAILASVSDVHILFDRQWHYVYLNDAAVAAIGMPLEEILGRTLWELYPDILGTELEYQLRRAMGGGECVAFIHHYRPKNTWWENRFRPTPEGLAVFATDITQHKRALELLRQREKELAEAQHLASVGTWAWDIKTDSVSWSDELYRILGLSPNEVRASVNAIIERVHPEDRERVLTTVQRCLRTHERFTQRISIIRCNGEERFAQITGNLVCDDDGSPLRLFGVCHDITEFEKSKEAGRAAERKYRQIFENVGEGIFQSTPEGCYLTANPALARMHGFSSAEELIGSCRDISREIYVDPARREEFKKVLETDGVVRGFEHETFRKDGSKIWISVNARAVRNETGNILYYEGTTQDITERKRTEEALRQSEERYRELFENSKDALYVHDMSGKYTSVNRAAEKLSGYLREELIGKYFWNFLKPEHGGLVRGNLNKSLEDSNETTYEAEIIGKDGRLIPVEISSRIIFANGSAVGVQGSVRDISERKRAQVAARTYSRHLIEAQEAERRRISRELHDQVGQILTAVKMNLHSLQRTCSAPEILASIKDNMDVIDEAVDQVRGLSIDLRPLLLDDLGLVVALRWYLERQKKSSGIATEFITRSLSEDDRFSSELETACFRIAQEAVTNVIRHANAGRIIVMLERSGPELVLWISDDGVGFDLGMLRSGAATLGLRGMEERVQALGGSLTIDSSPRLGTEICARFPIRGAHSRSLATALCEISRG